MLMYFVTVAQSEEDKTIKNAYWKSGGKGV